MDVIVVDVRFLKNVSSAALSTNVSVNWIPSSLNEFVVASEMMKMINISVSMYNGIRVFLVDGIVTRVRILSRKKIWTSTQISHQRMYTVNAAYMVVWNSRLFNGNSRRVRDLFVSRRSHRRRISLPELIACCHHSSTVVTVTNSWGIKDVPRIS